MPGWMRWGAALLVGLGIIAVGFRWAGWLLNLFFVLNCLVLVIVVLLQSGKAADLAGAFGGAGSQTAFGPRGAATVLSQATTWCAVMFMVCAMALALRVDKSVGAGGSVIYDRTKPAATKPAAPKTPATTPQTGQPSAPATQPAQPAPSSSAPPTQPPPNKKP